MSLWQTSPHPSRECCRWVLVMLCLFFFLFFPACRQILLSNQTNLLHREQPIAVNQGWANGKQHILSPLQKWYIHRQGEVNAELAPVCEYESEGVCVDRSACGQARANQSCTKYPAPRLCFGLLHPPPSHFSGFCCSISHSLHWSLWHTHTRAHTRSQCIRAQILLQLDQFPEQIKGLHISNCIPNVPPLYGSPSSFSCTFSFSSFATTGLLLLCTCFGWFFLLSAVSNLWQAAHLALQLRWPGSQPEAEEEEARTDTSREVGEEQKQGGGESWKGRKWRI